MRRLKLYGLLFTLIFVFTTIFMLKHRIQEPQKDEEINTFNGTYFTDEILGKEDMANQKTPDNQKTFSGDKGTEEEDKGIYEKDKVFKGKILDKMLDENRRESNTLKATDKNMEVNTIVTLEKILQVQNQIEDVEKDKIMAALLKLDHKEIDEVMSIIEKGVTEEDSQKLLEILKRKLSPKEVEYLVDVANKYFSKN
ncbi:MAG TPA: hypothetical protein GXX15_07565 [Clostridia bacterium]|nr:hypothetical protein [Clostridia bacterium]